MKTITTIKRFLNIQIHFFIIRFPFSYKEDENEY